MDRVIPIYPQKLCLLGYNKSGMLERSIAGVIYIMCAKYLQLIKESKRDHTYNIYSLFIHI